MFRTRWVDVFVLSWVGLFNYSMMTQKISHAFKTCLGIFGVEACESKRKSRTNWIINISWSHFILLVDKRNLCNRSNCWNAIFLGDLWKIKESSLSHSQKAVQKDCYPASSGVHDLVTNSIGKTCYWQRNVKEQTSTPDIVFFANVISQMVRYTSWTHQ